MATCACFFSRPAKQRHLAKVHTTINYGLPKIMNRRHLCSDIVADKTRGVPLDIFRKDTRREALVEECDVDGSNSLVSNGARISDWKKESGE